MFSYYGTKRRIIDLYPSPKYDLIIEPFAGAAWYSLKYFEKDVVLLDKYDKIIKLWKWLQQCSKKDILSLPILKYGNTLDDYAWDCDEAKTLIGFNIGMGSASPRNKASAWTTYLRPNRQPQALKRVAQNLYKIKHWNFVWGDYNSIFNVKATWFIDAPYQDGGSVYKYHDIDYDNLSKYCKNRLGQTIVCENNKASWLPFTPLVKNNGVKKSSLEVVYLS